MKNKLITKVVAPICLAGAIAIGGCEADQGFSIMKNYPSLRTENIEEVYSKDEKFCYSEPGIFGEQIIETCNYDCGEPEKVSIIPFSEWSYENKLSDLEKKAIEIVPSEKCEFVDFYKKRINGSIRDEVFSIEDLTFLNSLLGGYLNSEKKIPSDRKNYLRIEKEIREKILVNYPFLVEGIPSRTKMNLTYPAVQMLSQEEFQTMKDLGYDVGADFLLIKDLAEIYSDVRDKLTREKVDCGITNEFLKDTKNLFQDSLIKLEKENKWKKKRLSASILELGNSKLAFTEVKRGTIDDRLRTIIEKPDQTSLLTDNFLKQKEIPIRFPGWTLFFTIPFGLVGPFLRTCLLTNYVKRDYDGFDFVENLAGGVFGTLILDSLHPLVYPLRILGPIAFEPIRKIFDLRS